MKKRMIMILFILGIFMVGFCSVKANIAITCREDKCNNFTFKIVQLTSSNTGSGGNYSSYASHFQSYYQSTAACGYNEKAAACGANSTDLRTGYEFSGSYSTGTMGFDFYTNNGFHNMSNLIGTSKSYTKAGTYVFLLKATATSDGYTNTQLDLDKTEYVIYVNVKSDLTVGSIVAKKVKGITGNVLSSAEKVEELMYGSASVYPASVHGQTGDFYLLNKMAGDYADYSVETEYRVTVSTASSSNPITAKIYDKNGYVSDVVFNSSTEKSFKLKGGEALVFPRNSLSIDTTVSSYIYTMYGNGLADNSFAVYTPTIVYGSNGSSSSSASVMNGTNNYFSKTTQVKLGGQGKSFQEYTLTYKGSNVPETGVELGEAIPYAVIALLSVIVVVLVLLLIKRKKIKE